MRRTSASPVCLALLVLQLLLAHAVSARAQDKATSAKAAAQTGKMTICDHVGDDWKCVGAVSPWPADKSFNILLELPQAIDLISVGFIIHKRDEKGMDTDFVDEFELMVQGKARLFATEEGMHLPSGLYTIYAIDWTKRQVNEHPGNFKEYLGKTELIVR